VAYDADRRTNPPAHLEHITWRTMVASDLENAGPYSGECKINGKDRLVGSDPAGAGRLPSLNQPPTGEYLGHPPY
jgi:hypothetical protein